MMTARHFGLCALVLVWVPATVPAESFQPLFSGRLDFMTGANPAYYAIGDLNGDGHLDLAVPNDGYNGPSENLAILLGNGDGTFSARMSFAAGIRPSAASIGDYNEDGHPDVAVVNSSYVLVLPGSGDGTLQAAYEVLGFGEDPEALCTIDLNGDGHLDLAVGSRYGTVIVLLGNGDGTFLNSGTFVAGYAVRSVEAADLNGDGEMDLAVFTRSNYPDYPTGVSVLLGNGDATFQTHTLFSLGDFYGGLDIGDFDEDGIPDIAVGAAIFLGNGDGSFQYPVDYGVRGEVAVEDFDGDSHLDLAVIDQVDEALVIIPGRGDGTFNLGETYPLCSYPFYVASTDFNEDGRPDLSMSFNFDGTTVSVLLGYGNGTFPAGELYSTEMKSKSVAIGDINGDGHPDLATADYFALSLLLANGDGTFQDSVTYSVYPPRSVAMGDLNGDGPADLVVAHAYPTDQPSLVSVYFGNPAGSLGTPGSYAVGTTARSVAIGDVSGDGHPDLAVANSASNDVCVLVNRSDGTFFGSLYYPTDYGACSVAIGDLNGDGHPDLAVANEGNLNANPTEPGSFSVLFGSGDGTFQPPVTRETGGYPSSVAIGDLNGDGTPDLAVANRETSYCSPTPVDGELLVYMGTGNGDFQAPVSLTVGGCPSAVAIADLNGDGRPDFAVANRASGNVSVLLGDGDGNFAVPAHYGTGFQCESVGVGDLNGDGHLDLAATSSLSNLILLMNRGNGDPVCLDGDGDGWGDPGSPACAHGETDCDDDDPNVNPGVLEVCDNGIDDDCDGKIDTADPDCPAPPWAAAATIAAGGSPVLNNLGLILIAMGVVITLRILRRKT